MDYTMINKNINVLLKMSLFQPQILILLPLQQQQKKKTQQEQGITGRQT